MELTRKLVVITIAMLMKLFATSMVASNILGCSSSCDATRALGFSFVFKKLMSLMEREKKAVSAPAITADMSSNTNMAIMSMVAFDGENDPGDICNNSDVRFVSPSVLSKCAVVW